jgi:DNA polymerase-3 subunit beta
MMQNFYLKAEDNGLRIIGTDSENTIKIDIEADVEEKGEIVLPFKFVHETISTIPNDYILRFELKDDFMVMDTTDTKFKFVYANSSEYPKPPEYNEKMSFEINTELLSKMIKKTIFAVSTDKTNRIHLSGLNFKVMQKMLHIAGTDVRRLAYIKKNIDCDSEFSFTVPFETLKEVRALCDKNEKVKIVLTEKKNQIIFDFGDIIYYSRLLEEEFPDYLSIIPAGAMSSIKMSSDLFRQTLKMARPIANASSIKSVRFRLEDRNLTIEADAEEQGQFITSLKVDSQGDNADINFNIDYFYQASEICETENILIELNGPTRPSVVREEDNSDFVYIVMPLRG